MVRRLRPGVTRTPLSTVCSREAGSQLLLAVAVFPVPGPRTCPAPPVWRALRCSLATLRGARAPPADWPCPLPTSQLPTLRPFLSFFWEGHEWISLEASLCLRTLTQQPLCSRVCLSTRLCRGRIQISSSPARSDVAGTLHACPETVHCHPWAGPSLVSPGFRAGLSEVCPPNVQDYIVLACLHNRLVASHLTQHEIHFLPPPVARPHAL